MAELDFSIINSEEDLGNGKMDGLIHSSGLITQEDVNQAYNSFILQNWQDLKARIYTEFPQIDQKLTSKLKKRIYCICYRY